MTEVNYLNQALPIEFDFYHLGKIQLQPRESSDPVHTSLPTKGALPNVSEAGWEEGWDDFFLNRQFLGYSLQGDFGAWVILSLDSQMDRDMYSEVGNILASKIAGQLQKIQGWNIMISPPRNFTEGQIKQFLEHQQQEPLVRTYLHVLNSKIVIVDLMILPDRLEGIRHV